MKKLSLYLETSVVGFLFADYSPEKKLITEKLFEEIEKGKFEVYISDLVIEELEATKDNRLRKKLKAEIKNFKVMKVTDKCKKLALQYTDGNVIPKSVYADALHLAIAVIHNLDIVISWNLKHIVKVKTRREANAINLRNNYKTIEIATPEEVIDNE